MAPIDEAIESMTILDDDSETLENYREKLQRRMKITKSNRFNCAKRLERKANVRLVTINILSLLTILSGVYLLAFSGNLTISGAQFVGVFSIGVSVLSILLSPQGAVQDMSRRATDAHRCGREVSHIYRQLKAGTIEPRQASEEYEKVISSYEDNHDRCDFMSTLHAYKDEMAEEREEQGASWWNSVAASNFSAFSPFVYGVFGVSLIVGVCLCTPVINKAFEGVDGFAAKQRPPFANHANSQAKSITGEAPAD